CAVKQSPIIILIVDKFGHAAAMDHVAHIGIADIDRFSIACYKVFFCRNIRQIKGDALSFSHRNAKQSDMTYATRERFAYALRHSELLRSAQIELTFLPVSVKV